MPHRILGVVGVLVGVAGLAAVAVVLLAGRDARQAARTGPRWKRGLLAGGLALLGWLGVAVGQADWPVVASTWIMPGTPSEVMRLAMFTVSPHRS